MSFLSRYCQTTPPHGAGKRKGEGNPGKVKKFCRCACDKVLSHKQHTQAPGKVVLVLASQI